jgi:hypothetical protein
MYVVIDVETNGLNELIDWVYYPSNHDELENHEEPRPTMHTLWIQLLRVLALIATVRCAICGRAGEVVLWTTQTRSREFGEYVFSMKNIPQVWICDTHEM